MCVHACHDVCRGERTWIWVAGLFFTLFQRHRPPCTYTWSAYVTSYSLTGNTDWSPRIQLLMWALELNSTHHFKCHSFRFLSKCQFISHRRNLVTLHSCTLSVFSLWLIEEQNLHFGLFFCLDPFGKTDEREPLTNAVRSDSAVIGGKVSSLLKAGKISMILCSAEKYLKPSLPMNI